MTLTYYVHLDHSTDQPTGPRARHLGTARYGYKSLKVAIQMCPPGCGDPALLTRSPIRSIASAADLAPPAQRPGAEDALAYPSRIGSRLHYRDGRVTDLGGNPIFSPQEPQA